MIAATNRAVTVLVRRVADAPLAALTEAPAHQQGAAASLDRIAINDTRHYQQPAPAWNSRAQKASLIASHSSAAPQPQSPAAALEAEYVTRWRF